jgi:hypothetical protein
MHNSDELDRRIDAALAGYGDPSATHRDAEPALAERMLAGVRRSIAAEIGAPSWARRHGWIWALAAAACVVALVLFGLRPARRQQPNQARQTQQQGTNAEVATTITATTAAAPKPAVRKSARAGSRLPTQGGTESPDRLPKLDVFPTRLPLSEEGEALAFFVRRAPAHEVRELLQAQARLDTPITIQELEIPPLKPLDEGGK